MDSIRTLELKVYNDYYATRKENISIKNQNINIGKHNLHLLEKNNRNNDFIIVLGIIIFIAISISIIHRKKHKASKNTIKNTIKKNELLNEILCAKDKKLFNQNILRKQKEEELKYIHDNLTNQNSNIIKNFKVNSSIKSLESLITTKIEKKDIIKNLMDENFLLVAKLKVFCPELSKTEVLHCLLVMQEISLKEVASLLNVSIGTVKSARYRAKLKLNIPKNKSLKRFLILAQKDIDWLFKQRD